jgi:hypothetical protein
MQIAVGAALVRAALCSVLCARKLRAASLHGPEGVQSRLRRCAQRNSIAGGSPAFYLHKKQNAQRASSAGPVRSAEALLCSRWSVLCAPFSFAFYLHKKLNCFPARTGVAGSTERV